MKQVLFFFYPQWKNNEIRKLYFASALIKKEDLSFLLQNARGENNRTADCQICLAGYQDLNRFPE